MLTLAPRPSQIGDVKAVPISPPARRSSQQSPPSPDTIIFTWLLPRPLVARSTHRAEFPIRASAHPCRWPVTLNRGMSAH